MFRIFKTVLLPAVMVLALFVIPSDRTSAEEPQLTGNVPDSGVALVSWSGGTVAELLLAAGDEGCSVRTLGVFRGGSWFGYVVGAPDFANGGFLDLYPGGAIPASTILVLVCTPSDTPAAAATPRRGGALIVALAADVNTLDPVFSVSAADVANTQVAYDNLVLREADGSLRPMLAESWAAQR